MKRATQKQIEVIKQICKFETTKFHGNRKQVHGIPVKEYLLIRDKRLKRFFNSTPPNFPSKIRNLIYLINWSIECQGTNYQKIFIEGFTGIYYAHPFYQHSDYNKHRVFEKNEKNLRLIEIANSLISKGKKIYK